MESLRGRVKHYAWGSRHLIPALFDQPPHEQPVAELWLGTHPGGPALVGERPVYSADDDEAGAPGAGHPRTLEDVVAADPGAALGPEVFDRYGARLPYLLKIIAPAAPLSLQVHPSIAQAEAGYAAEDAAGVDISDPTRNYKDRNHKPELLLALSEYEALCGFRAPRRVLDVLETLSDPVSQKLHAILRADTNAEGVQRAFECLLSADSRPSPDAVAAVAAGCAARLNTGTSPSVRADRIVVLLAEHYPGDPGVVASLLLNPVTLHPGEALFVPAGSVHAYLSGVGVEIMAASDNVLRAGLSPKHIDVPELLRTVDYVAAPPIRIAPERTGPATRTYFAPVDDFELSLTELTDAHTFVPLPGRGPRVLLTLRGAMEVECGGGETAGQGTAGRARAIHTLKQGEAIFVGAGEGDLRVRGVGQLVQADVP